MTVAVSVTSALSSPVRGETDSMNGGSAVGPTNMATESVAVAPCESVTRTVAG